MPLYKNRFQEPEFIEHSFIRDEDDKKVGTLRIKPSGLLWKPSNSKNFYKVSLDEFSDWIVDLDKRRKQ